MHPTIDPKKPLLTIGISADFTTYVDHRGIDAQRFQLCTSYADAVTYAGGLPLILPHGNSTLHNEIGAKHYLSLIDGLLLSGGDFDLPPKLYGEETHPLCAATFPARTEFEMLLLKGALEKNMPILGICGGMQVINVYFGGTLHQDLSLRPNTAVHIQPHDKHKPHHAITLTPDTALAHIALTSTNAASDTKQTNSKNRLVQQVNSTHHQIINKVGAKLTVNAISEDGAIEGIESTEGTEEKFLLGVQWHPEALLGTQSAAQEDPFSTAIYASFINSCGSYSSRSGGC